MGPRRSAPSGQRLFADGGPGAKFTLAATEDYESGVVHLGYRPRLT